MKRSIEGEARTQVTLLPGSLDDFIIDENPLRAVDVFSGELDPGLHGLHAGLGSPSLYHGLS
ncbi:hypothetical protein EJA05_18390 [Pseudomonas oryziphila]|uniref:Transposase n=1 Tax=Pseudomonas entomophila TaxID=312306 RepID=A0A3Q8TVZ1_9PSED|nr:hypothetical protein EJA05_18390 [Pseudomonas oryziphila]